MYAPNRHPLIRHPLVRHYSLCAAVALASVGCSLETPDFPDPSGGQAPPTGDGESTGALSDAPSEETAPAPDTPSSTSPSATTDGPPAEDSGSDDEGSPDASSTGAPVDPPAGECNGYTPIDATCTLVLGHSQTRNWFLGGGFEELVEDEGRWQVTGINGAGVNHYAEPDALGYRQDPTSPCAQGSGDPDRVIWQLAPAGSIQSIPDPLDPNTQIPFMEDAIANIQMHYPSVQQIVLVSLAGGPGGEQCPGAEGNAVAASRVHQPLLEAIETMALEDETGLVVAGPIPTIPDCECYADPAGHLRECGASAVAAHFASCFE